MKSLRDNYVGEKRNHLRDGYGVYKYENKFFKYEGQWNAGKKHGHGKLLMKDGSFYEGEFKDGEITGHGFKYWSSSRNTYSGQFYLGELEGDGVMRYSDGSVYEGHWINNKREGQGKLTEVDGSLYDGEFHNNKKHGFGRFLSSHGFEYEGGYILDKRHGHGVFKMADGSVFDGQWSNDVFNGEGTLMHVSGFVYEGIWINGKPANMATKIEITDIDTSVGITITQGENFDIKIRTVNDDGEPVADNGREFKVTAGYKYVPAPQPNKESANSSLFDAIEDAEEHLIQTPLGYTVLPYPLTDQPSAMSLQSEDTELLEKDEQSAENAAQGDPEHGCEEEPQTGDSDDVSNQRPCTQRCEDGVCSFSGLQLLPPPPLYRPFQIATEKSSTDLKSKGSSKKASTPKIGTYVLMIEDVTDPPFLDESLPTVFTLITVKKKKRETATPAKEKAPK